MKVYIVKSACDGTIFEVVDSFKLAISLVQEIISDWCTMSGEYVEFQSSLVSEQKSAKVTVHFGNKDNKEVTRRVFSITEHEVFTR